MVEVPDERVEEVLDQALALGEEGEYEEVLALLEEVPPQRGERWVLAADAWLELGRTERAAAAIDEAARLLGDDHPDVLWGLGRVRLSQWRFADARRFLERLDVRDEGPALLELLAVVADAEGDAGRSHQLLERAHELDPEGAPEPLRLSPETMRSLVDEAAKELPDEFRRALEETAVVIDPMPARDVVDPDRSGHPPDLLGLFVGRPFSERDSSVSGELPPTIYLFQRNLERSAGDADELREEIAKTLYHELGHALGFDEDEVDGMGLA